MSTVLLSADGFAVGTLLTDDFDIQPNAQASVIDLICSPEGDIDTHAVAEFDKFVTSLPHRACQCDDVQPLDVNRLLAEFEASLECQEQYLALQGLKARTVLEAVQLVSSCAPPGDIA
jgi:hypothetical protein